MKASFHRDGRCQLGFTSEYEGESQRRFPGRQSRHWRRWQVALDRKVRLAQVMTPASDLRGRGAVDSNGTVWLTPPSPMEACVVSILSVPVGMSMAISAGDGVVVAPLAVLENTVRTVWVLGAQQPLDAATSDWVEGERTHMRTTASQTADDLGEATRAALFSHPEDGTARILDLAWDP